MTHPDKAFHVVVNTLCVCGYNKQNQYLRIPGYVFIADRILVRGRERPLLPESGILKENAHEERGAFRLST